MILETSPTSNLFKNHNLKIYIKNQHKISEENIKSLQKCNVKSQYRNFFGRFLAVYFSLRNPVAGVAVS